MNEEEAEYGYPLSGEELRRVIATTPEERVAYFVEKCNESGQVWTVATEEDIVVLAGENDEPFVLAFPHPDFGQDWFTTTDVDDVELVAIGTEDWAREILPGLQEAEIPVLVFPTSEGDGTMTQPEELAKLLLA